MKKRVFFYIIFLTYTSLAQNLLMIPDTVAGSTLSLSLQHGSVNFFPGLPTTTMGVNGNILGPTLILNKHQDVTINVNNQLMDTTTIHWHGLHVSPHNDGGPHIIIPPGTTWSPHFKVMDNAATYWYHPHLHHHTNKHVSKGIAGFIIVRDEQEAELNLPRTYGKDDIPLVVQTKSFNSDNQIIFDNAADSVLMVNATQNPYYDLPAQVVRLRLLNGSSERVFNFGFSNNQPFYQIASDGGLLSAPVQLTRLMLASGERAEILINLTSLTGETIFLMNYGAEIPSGIYGAAQPGIALGQVIPGYNLNPLNGSNYNILRLNVLASTPNPVTSIPQQLVSLNPWSINDVDTTRTFIFSTNAGPSGILGPFRINGAFYDMNVINEYVPLNNTEIWVLRNQTPIAHPFHIHGVQFYILDINGVPPPANLSGRKDVILVRGGNSVVRFITKFETFADTMHPFMYHCHMLTHEDEGMMGQFLVVPGIIPVELISFTATVNGSDVSLEWTTATEMNNYGFEIEGKNPENGNGNWNTLGFIEGAGTSSERNSYRFDVKSLSGNHYLYRLKQIDFDGAYKYSSTIEVNTGIFASFYLEQNYPNPFNPTTYITYSLPEEGIADIRIYDMLGREAAILVNEKKSAGRHQFLFEGSSLASGVYICRLSSGKYTAVKKIQLLK
jgi:blue copper oxidase